MKKRQESLVITPLVTQVRNPFCIYDCGMTYLIRIEDGSFILIDGGVGEYEEADHLWDLICAQHETAAIEPKPVIAAWFITHPHSDHFGGFVRFMDQYSDRVILKSLLYHWPIPEKTAPFSDMTEFNRTVALLGAKTEVITPHTGQRFCYAGTVIDILFTCEDLYPADIPNLNDTSLVMRMEINGRRILWLGDSLRQTADFLCKKYPAKEFQCEFLQVGHHGYSGGSDELYRMADPEVLFWPCPDFWYPVVSLWPENDYLIHSPKIQEIIVSGRGEVTIDMTEPVPAFLPYKKVKTGEIIYEERFDKERVIDLCWACLTGGKSGYRAAGITLKKGECQLEAADGWSVCEFVQPGLMSLHPDFELTISGSLESNAGQFGLFWDYLSPMTFAEECVLWLDSMRNSFQFRLRANPGERKANLYLGDRLIKTLPYETAGGLYFVLKDTKVTLHHICLKNCGGGDYE